MCVFVCVCVCVRVCVCCVCMYKVSQEKRGKNNKVKEKVKNEKKNELASILLGLQSMMLIATEECLLG